MILKTTQKTNGRFPERNLKSVSGGHVWIFGLSFLMVRVSKNSPTTTTHRSRQVLSSGKSLTTTQRGTGDNDEKESHRISLPSVDWDEYWIAQWDKVCDLMEAHGGFVGTSLSHNVLRRIVINAPVVLGFCTLCTMIHVLVRFAFPNMERVLAIQDRIRWDHPIQQVTSLLTHVLVHSSHDHLKGNMVHILLVGPTVEHEFGSSSMACIFVLVAVVSALVHILVGNVATHQLGASGVVFCCILLNSLVSATYGKIPLSFILTTIIWLGDELVQFLWPTNNISHHAHLSGGLVGAFAGYYIQRQRSLQKQSQIVQHWFNKVRKDKIR
jgi:rhomboid protease GluP